MKKKYFKGFFAAIIFCLTIAGVNTSQIQAASKASYTVKKIQDKEQYKRSKVSFLYELPQFKGNSNAVKKINRSLRKGYKDTLSHKKEMFDLFEKFKEEGALEKKKIRMYVNTKYKVNYSKNGCVMFTFTTSVENGTKRSVEKKVEIYRLRDGAKLKHIPTSDPLELVQGEWYNFGGMPYRHKYVISGSTVKVYAVGGKKPYRIDRITKIVKTSYGYYYVLKSGTGYRCCKDNGYQWLFHMGYGDPYSTQGYSGTDSMGRGFDMAEVYTYEE